jgi:hypothetical protein
LAPDERKRRVNERKFGYWEDLPGGGRRYWYEIQGRRGWRARYVKEVDSEERVVRFWQEIIMKAVSLWSDMTNILSIEGTKG